MQKLKENPTLADFQKHIKDMCIERGWDKNSHLEIFLLFTEEVGELAKAIRNKTELYAEDKKTIKHQELEDELADVFNYLLDLANYFDIDLETAYRNKDKKNSERIWKSKQ